MKSQNGITLFHNSRCSKSRAALEILQKSGKPYEVVEYLKTPPTTEVLDTLLKQLGKEPEEIVRTGEEEFENLKHLPKSRKEWIELMVKYPILIERPIVSDGKTAVIGRPPENVSAWLKNRSK